MYSLMIKLCMRTMELSGLCLPLLYHADLIRNPCLPIHLGGYWIVYDQCKGKFGVDLQPTWSLNEVLSKLVVFGVSYFNWSFLLSGFSFHLSLSLLLKSYCLRSYIKFAGDKILGKSWKVNESTCRIYREVQLLGLEYRIIYSKYMTANVLISIIFVHTISLYACLNFGLDLPITMFCMFFMAAVDSGFVILIIYSSLANVFKTSKVLIERRLKSGRVTKQGKWFKMFVMSCSNVRVYVGDRNFVDELTPLTVEDLAIQQTISLMLVDK